MTAGLTYAKTKYRGQLVGNDSGAPLDQALRLLPGNNLSNAPELVATGSVAWTPDIGSSGLTGLVYVDGRMTSDYNTGSDLFRKRRRTAMRCSTRASACADPTRKGASNSGPKISSTSNMPWSRSEEHP